MSYDFNVKAYSINVTYPLMKMELHLETEHQISSDTTLNEIQVEIFEQVWTKALAFFGPTIPHGAPEQVVLSVDGVEILDSSSLKAAAIQGKAFTAVFMHRR